MAWMKPNEGWFSGEDVSRLEMLANRYADKLAKAKEKAARRPYRVYWSHGTNDTHYWLRGQCSSFKTSKEAMRKAGKVRIGGATAVYIREWNSETQEWRTYNDRKA
jgi:ABC-type Fe3+-hydroxamate transport system substrate-binding protein